MKAKVLVDIPVSIKVDQEMFNQLAAEAYRQDRPVSWLMRTAWRLALPQLLKLPGVKDK